MENKETSTRIDYAKELNVDVDHLETTVADLKKKLVKLLLVQNNGNNQINQEINEINDCIPVLEDMALTTRWRILNVVLRWYDLPLQWATVYHPIERIMPKIWSFTRPGFHRKF